MAKLFTFRSRSLGCDVACFISDDEASASSLLINFVLARPAPSRDFDLYCIGEVPINGDTYAAFGYEEPRYIRSYKESQEPTDAQHS